MPHIAARYTPDQRDAIRRLMDDEGRTAAEAVALAAEGVYGLEPFEMPASSAPQIARRERAKQERIELAELERGSPEERLLATRRWLFERHRAEVRRFCSERQAGDFTLSASAGSCACSARWSAPCEDPSSDQRKWISTNCPTEAARGGAERGSGIRTSLVVVQRLFIRAPARDA